MDFFSCYMVFSFSLFRPLWRSAVGRARGGMSFFRGLVFGLGSGDGEWRTFVLWMALA